MSIPAIRSIPARTLDRSTLGQKTFFHEVLDDFLRYPVVNAFLTTWIRKFGIADEIVCKQFEGTGIVQVFLKKDGVETNLVDVGYGFSQLLPIIIKIANHAQSAIIIVEEPETNLHPALQSLLADFFVDAQKTFNAQIIIETHSEYLIRKMQYLICKDEIANDKVNMYYFQKPDEEMSAEDQIFEITFDNLGRMSREFGPGFFDEADNIAVDLFNLQHKDN